MPLSPLPAFPYGAVYFRKSNPPKEDWARDYRTASEDGMNIFRHWFLWSAIEVAPGQFDWADYDRQMELAAANGIRTIIAEMDHAAPEWAFRKLAHARYETRDGKRLNSEMGGSCITGGFPGLCLDNDDALALVEKWMRELASRYKGHKGLGGYDLWNECNYGHNVCFCPATADKFRAWLRSKYGDLKTLGQAWFRHSFADWEDIVPPRHTGAYPDVLDWLQFRIERAYDLMRWRSQIIRSIDPDCALTAHGIAATLGNLAPGGSDDWRAAANVEVYGYTWGSCRNGDEPWKQYHAVDLVRCASRGKPFWHAENYAGPLWMAGNVLNKPRNEGRIATPPDMRLWTMVSFAAGASGSLYLRWRPLLDGPLFGAFGPYAMDGSRTDRSAMSSRLAKWTNSAQQRDLWQSRPVRGDIGILIIPETQLFLYAQQGDTAHYAESLKGAYQGFFHHNIQADWVRMENIDEYDLLYLPIPIMLPRQVAKRLEQWVRAGGTLISEGCPAYFADRGHVGTRQPNLGLDELFGVTQSYVEFTPDLLADLDLTIRGQSVRGGLFLQTYDLTTGQAVGHYADGRIAAVENRPGSGRTLLIGTFPGYGHSRQTAAAVRQANCAMASILPVSFFADLLTWANKHPHVRTSEPRITARLHDGPGGTYLFLTNPTPHDLLTRIELNETYSPFTAAESLWGTPADATGRSLSITVPARDAAVLRLVPG